MYKFEIIVFFVLLVFGLSLFASFIYSGGDVLASIYPELIGFSFEGIFLVVLLTWLQRRKDNESEIKKKDNLKSALREQLLIFFQWARPVHSDVSYIELFTLPQALKGITKELEEQGKLTDVQPYFLRSFAGREVSSLEALLPVAAGIDERHLRCWRLIINNLKGIRDSKSDEELFRALIDFLGFTIEFVELKI